MVLHIPLISHFLLPPPFKAKLLRCPERHLKTTHMGVLLKKCLLDTTNINDSRVFTLDTTNRGDTLLEVMVPTCSYRMGVAQMGYTAVIVRK